MPGQGPVRRGRRGPDGLAEKTAKMAVLGLPDAIGSACAGQLHELPLHLASVADRWHPSALRNGQWQIGMVVQALEGPRSEGVSALGAKEGGPADGATDPSFVGVIYPLVIAVLSHGVSAWQEYAVLPVVVVPMNRRGALRQRVGSEVTAREALHLEEDIRVPARSVVVLSKSGPIRFSDNHRTLRDSLTRTVLRSVIVAYLAFPVVVIGFCRQLCFDAYL